MTKPEVVEMIKDGNPVVCEASQVQHHLDAGFKLVVDVLGLDAVLQPEPVQNKPAIKSKRTSKPKK